MSSINDWFPIHLMPVVPFSMLFDYNLMQDISRDSAMNRDTNDSVAKFKEGYNAVLNHCSNIRKFEPA